MEESMGLAVEVRSVWKSNLEEEFRRIRQAITTNYYFITFDTEFKLAPNPNYKRNMINTHPRFASPNERYCAIKESIDKGDIRQLGLTLSANDGSVIVWEFNFAPFHFPGEKDTMSMMMWSNDLINTYYFSEHLLSSGLLENRMMTWIIFHGAYDVAYLIKLVNFWSPLPDTLVEFQSLVKNYIGENVFDVKFMMKYTNNLYGGLEEVATELNVNRVVGMAHQAGSDSLLTWHIFQKLKKVYFPYDSGIRYEGVLYGIHDI